ncbi:MAG: biotin transporter BioY [Gammaproteobacteria bacterium]
MPHPTLAGALWRPQARMQRTLRALALATAGSLLLALSAKVQIPFYPVPLTMQTFVVLVIGIVYGARLGAATMLLYLAEGAAGLPVFAGGGGLAYFTGPTAGFLFAFVGAAALLGALAERGFARTFASTIAVMLIGTAVIFAGGLAWLATFITWQKAVAVGFTPFIFSETLKIFLAALSLPAAWKLAAKIGNAS